MDSTPSRQTTVVEIIASQLRIPRTKSSRLLLASTVTQLIMGDSPPRIMLHYVKEQDRTLTGLIQILDLPKGTTSVTDVDVWVIGRGKDFVGVGSKSHDSQRIACLLQGKGNH